MTNDVAAGQLMSELETWVAPTDRLGQLREEYLRFLDEGGTAALRRSYGPAHLTASCFVFSADLTQTLLCFHRKGRFWVQTGGHIETDDDSVPAAALREARKNQASPLSPWSRASWISIVTTWATRSGPAAPTGTSALLRCPRRRSRRK